MLERSWNCIEGVTLAVELEDAASAVPIVRIRVGTAQAVEFKLASTEALDRVEMLGHYLVEAVESIERVRSFTPAGKVVAKAAPKKAKPRKRR